MDTVRQAIEESSQDIDALESRVLEAIGRMKSSMVTRTYSLLGFVQMLRIQGRVNATAFQNIRRSIHDAKAVVECEERWASVSPVLLECLEDIHKVQHTISCRINQLNLRRLTPSFSEPTPPERAMGTEIRRTVDVGDSDHLLPEMRRFPVVLPGGTTREFVYQSRRVKDVMDQVEYLSSRDDSVLIQGESGSGKGYIAAALIMMSPRKDKEIHHVNCSAIPETMLESELFGHEKGAFTSSVAQKKGLLERADGGVVFLDEIGDMSPGIQAKLLVALQQDGLFYRVGGSKPIKANFRLICATHQDLKKRIETKEFRLDLYQRIAQAVVKVPSWKERADAPFLVSEFIKKKDPHALIDDDARLALVDEVLSGNLREAENIINQALMYAALEAKGRTHSHVRKPHIERALRNAA